MNPLALGAIVETVGKVAGDLVTTEKERRELDIREREIDQRDSAGQVETNKLEAQNSNLFVAGWRPAIGWTCAIALFCYYVPYVLAATVLWIMQVLQKGELVTRPDLGIADLMALVIGMLGLGTMRTVEKLRAPKSAPTPAPTPAERMPGV